MEKLCLSHVSTVEVPSPERSSLQHMAEMGLLLMVSAVDSVLQV